MEHERLNKIIGAICTNRTALQDQFEGLTSPPAEGFSSQTRKRKIDATDMNGNNGSVCERIDVRNQIERNGTDHSFKRFKEDNKPNVNVTYTRISASDSSLVSNYDQGSQIKKSHSIFSNSSLMFF